MVWPTLLSYPQATTVPLALSATEWKNPAATATTCAVGRFLKGCRHLRLAIVVSPPGDDGAVGLERHHVFTRRDGRDILQVGREVGLLVGIVAPSDGRLGTDLERHHVVFTCGDSHDTGQVGGRNVRLAEVPISPSDDGAVGLERHGVVSTRGDGNDVRQVGWFGLTKCRSPKRRRRRLL